MKKVIYVLFLVLFVSSAQAHKAHDDALLQELKPVISKKAFEDIKKNIKDFSLESHYMYKNTALDNNFLEVLTTDKFNKKDYVKILKEIYKDNEFAKSVNMQKSAEILAKLDKQDRAVLANVLKSINQHKH